MGQLMPWSAYADIARNTPNLAPKSDRFSPLPQTPLGSLYENFARHQIFRGNRPLANGEESVQISGPVPKLWVPQEGYKFRG